MSKEIKEKLVNFKIESQLYEKLFFLARDLYGHGGIKKLYNELSKDFVSKFEGQSAKLDTFLDPNFTPKPTIHDDVEKIVMPYVVQLSESELHRLRSWAYQTHIICTAYSKLSPQRRKVSKMTYQECIEIIRRAENGV